MKNIFLTTILITFSVYMLSAQNDILPAQYYQVISVLNSSLTGVNDPLEVITGYSRRQTSLEESPSVFYFNGEGVLQPGEGSSTYRERKRMIYWDGNQNSKTGLDTKLGLGAFLLGSNQGLLRRYNAGVNGAVHIPIASNMAIALGLSPRILTSRIDLSQITIRDPINDQTYQSLVQNGASNTYFNLNSGLSVYAPNFYFAYGADQLTSAQVSGNEDFGSESTDDVIHHFIGSYTFQINPDFELIPNAFVRIDKRLPTFYDVTIRGRYQENVWAGFSYRSDDTFIGSLGFTMNNGIILGYSYQLQTGMLNEFNNGSHEIVLGVSFL